jgi:hypothetical protein
MTSDSNTTEQTTTGKEAIIAAINGALATTGKNKGRLKSKCPPMGTDEAAAWQAMMMLANPYKVSLFATCLFTERQQWVYRNVLAALEPLDLRTLDRDRVALEALGAW